MNNIIDITLENFQQVILETSQQKLVMVDFWADWCEPCKNLMPVLEALAREYPQDLVLAKVNCDEQQQIAAQFGVRSLPTVILVKDGQPVDGFAGVQGEGEIRSLLDKHLPKPEEALFTEARALVDKGDFNAAFAPAKQAHELNPSDHSIKCLLIDIDIELGRLDEAKALLASISLVDQDADFQSLAGKIALAEEAAESPEIRALEEQLAADPDNLDLKLKLGVQLQQANRHGEALEMLYAVVKTDMAFGDGKKLLIDAINALPEGDPLAAQYRRKMYGLLY